MLEHAPRETALEAGGYAKGVAVALVTQNSDPEGLGRVKVRFPWHTRPSESHWARIAVPMAGKERGTFFLPEPGDEVLVAFEREDIRFPYVVGALWNGKDKPPATNADGRNDLRFVRSRKGHELTFDDGARGRVELKLNDGKRRLSIEDDTVRLEDGQGNSLEFSSTGGSVTLRASRKLALSAPAISIEASGTLELKAGPTLTIKGGLVQIN
ncbi:phage baseplate assembly protein V [Siccirubricoccus sp. G192]|uniref:phage baseplate assembly protein V n=1 Tax=Siccirubricoccus sp. G192 TaxID=2849651 RepID=UPI0020C53F88|nr:phage baseplate assembly protein V [Siccirubricoccus sp. G192]